MPLTAAGLTNFGTDVRQRRKALGLTQDELGRRAACSGHAIRKIEANERRPSSRLADRLALHLKVPPNQFQAFTSTARGRVEPEPALAVTPLDQLPFVGRDEVMRMLRERLARLGSGPAHAVLIQGDTGMGKTRLLEELAEQAARLDITTLKARACPITQDIPFNIIDQWLHQLLPHVRPGELDSLPEISRIELSRLLPSLHTCLHVAAPTLGTGPEDMHRLRCMDALRCLFERVAQGRRLVLVIDDLPWIDVRSAEVVGYLMLHGASAGWMLVLSGRVEEQFGSHTGLHVQQALAITRCIETVMLGCLDRTDIAKMVRTLVHPQSTAAFPDADLEILTKLVWDASKGHPLFLDHALLRCL